MNNNGCVFQRRSWRALRNEYSRSESLGELGEAKIPNLDESFLNERRATVARVQEATRAYGFKKGDIFMRTPYSERVERLNRRHQASAPTRLAVELFYRLRARLRDLY